jgi:hypothetical protein
LLLELERAYVKRQQWIAKLHAVEVVNALGSALGGKSAGSGGSSVKPYRETSLEGLMGQMGTSWQ